MWSDSTFIDTVTTGSKAQSVVQRRLHEELPFDPITNPLVMKIDNDGSLQSFAALIMCRDILARLDAFSSIDFSGQWPPPSPLGYRHGAFEVTDRNRDFPLDQELAAVAAGLPGRAPSGGSGSNFLWSGMDRVPRCGAGAIFPEMSRSATGIYSPAVARGSAVLLNAARATKQAANVARDAGLAATIASTWTAARAEFLAQAQAAYPERGYV